MKISSRYSPWSDKFEIIFASKMQISTSSANIFWTSMRIGSPPTSAMSRGRKVTILNEKHSILRVFFDFSIKIYFFSTFSTLLERRVMVNRCNTTFEQLPVPYNRRSDCETDAWQIVIKTYAFLNKIQSFIPPRYPLISLLTLSQILTNLPDVNHGIFCSRIARDKDDNCRTSCPF